MSLHHFIGTLQHNLRFFQVILTCEGALISSECIITQCETAQGRKIYLSYVTRWPAFEGDVKSRTEAVITNGYFLQLG